MNGPLHRPKPILNHNAPSVNENTSPEAAAQRLLNGEQLLVTDLYSTGVNILAHLQSLLPTPKESAPHAERQAHRDALREASLRLLVPIRGKRVGLQDGRTLDMLTELYPKLRHFFLPFIQMQELHGASYKYRNGVHLAVLGHKIYPFYGTYVPTRTSHLELFGTWISQYSGPKTHAIDVGTGCGVLALMLCRSGFARVLATDTNPNAIESVRRDLTRRPQRPPVDTKVCDLLGDDPRLADLIVFNPPWTRATQKGLLDEALHFDDDVFERFFDQALTRLTPGGRVVLLFSNVMSLVQPEEPHPIETELARGRFTLAKKLQRKVKPGLTASGKKRRTREKVEVWELVRAE